VYAYCTCAYNKGGVVDTEHIHPEPATNYSVQVQSSNINKHPLKTNLAVESFDEQDVKSEDKEDMG
jgi:hypothetical protein